MKLTIFENNKGTVKQEHDASWAEVVEELRNAPAVAKKDDSQMIKLAIFGEHKTPKGSYRHDANLISISGIELDYDAGKITPEQASEKMEAHSLRAAVITTYSHTASAPRLRLLLPTSIELPSSARLRLAEGVNGLFDGALAPESANLSQSYYVSPREGAEHKVLTTFDDPEEGLCIDEWDDLDMYRRPFACIQKSETENPDSTSDDWLQQITSGDNVHDGAMKVIARMVSQGIEPNVIRATFEALRHKIEEVRGAERASCLVGSELDRMIEGAVQKFAPPVIPPVDFAPSTIRPSFMERIAKLKQRPYLLGKSILRGYLTVMQAPGGVGKSALTLCMGASVATGLPLLGMDVHKRANVLLINNEDDIDEMDRRLAGIIQRYALSPADLEQRLFYFSGYGNPLTVARRIDRDTVIATPAYEELRDFITQNEIELICVDPFISTHDVEENNNTAIDKVVQQFKRLAHETGAAIVLVHHTRKSGNDSEAHAGDAESGRGASSLKDAARCVMTSARMNAKTAEQLGIDDDERARHIRVDTGKSNFSLSGHGAEWYRMDSVQISNGDWVGVPVPVNLGPLFEASENKGKKWTATTVAETLERVMGKRDMVAWTEIRPRFMAECELKKSRADEIRTLLSDDPKNPTRIRNSSAVYVHYWWEKAHPTAPVNIHRQEVSS